MTDKNDDFMPQFDTTENNLELMVNDEEEEEVGELDNEVSKGEEDELEEDLAEQQEEIVEVKPKDRLNTDDVFGGGYEKVKEREEKPLKVKRVRKPMTEEHKAKLKLAREKSLEVRRAKKNAKDKVARKNAITEGLQEEQELVEKVVNEKRIKFDIPEDKIEEITAKAINKYDTLRKERKEKKRQDQEVFKEQQRIRSVVNQAVGRKVGDAGFFSSHCF